VGRAKAMPTVFSGLLDDLGNDLDEKARQSLLSDIDNVSGLSILQRLLSNQSQVRNASAFVSTSIRKNPERPGKLELEHALKRLDEAGLLDEKVADQLRACPLQVACDALEALLTQPLGAVRNPSAYVSRNLANSRKSGVEEPGYRAAPELARAPKQPAPRAEPVWMPPSREPGPRRPAPASLYDIFPGGLLALDELLARWRELVDKKAWGSLMTLGEVALDILQDLDSKGDQIHNPSGYVQRSVNNYLKESREASHASHASHPAEGRVSKPALPRRPVSAAAVVPPKRQAVEGGAAGLDEKATAALAEATPEAAAYVMADLEARAHEIRNPSAYVQRALANARQGKGGAAVSDFATPGHHDAYPTGYDETPTESVPEPATANNTESLMDLLDESARNALENDVGPEVADAILARLEAEGGKVHNPSAYVLRAVRNAQQGKGTGKNHSSSGAAPAAGEAEQFEHELEQELLSTAPLDDKARAALKELSAEAALLIVRHLNREAGQVRNASAYICKAVGNAKRPSAAQLPPGKRQRI